MTFTQTKSLKIVAFLQLSTSPSCILVRCIMSVHGSKFEHATGRRSFEYGNVKSSEFCEARSIGPLVKRY